MEFIDLKTQYSRNQEAIDAGMRRVLEHGRFIMGPEVADLEGALAGYVGVDHCIGVSSGTDALLIALMALGVKPGDEVITSAFTFVSTGEVIALLGARPVYVDIDPATYNLDPAGLQSAITDKTTAIIGVSLYGQCADFEAINRIAAEHGLPVIEDGAQSFGATYMGRRSCGLTTIGCTSFFPSKPLGCYGDGGAIFTRDEELAQRMRWLRVHGQDRRYHHAVLGVNGRLDTLQAAVVLAKLETFDEEVEARARVGARYTEQLSAASVVTPTLAPGCTSVYGQYTVQVERRDDVRERLTEQGVPTAVHYPIPLYRQPALRDDAFHLQVTEMVSERVLSLPMHPFLSDEDQDQVIAAVKDAVQSV